MSQKSGRCIAVVMFQLSSSGAGAAALKYQGVILGQDIIQVICLCGAPECPRIGFSALWSKIYLGNLFRKFERFSG
jgi:hypothetical protein